MNDMEANLRQFFDVRRGSVELSSTEAPQKLNSCLLKLRQLVKKNSIHASPNQTFQQNPDNHMSKQTMEGTLWETCSPTASYLNDSVQLVVKKPRNTASNKLNMTVTSKANSQNSFALYQPNIEDMKGRTPSTRPSSTKVNGLMSNMSSPKATYLDLNVTDHLNGSRSTKSAAFNPHKFINFLLSQPKTSTNQGKKVAKVNSCMQGEEENDDNNTKNISGEAKGTTKSFATFKKSVADVKSTVQQEGQENKVPVIQEYNLEKLRVSKSKVKIGLQVSELKKNERSLTLTKKSSSGNLRKKKDLHAESDSLNEVEKNKRDTIDKSRSKKRLAVTPDTLTHRERENEPEVQIDNKALRLTPKLFKACNDLLASRKDSAQKDARLKSRKRSSTRSKGQRLKSASKRNLKQESPVKNAVAVERAGNSRRQNAPGLMLRAVKGSTPNILSSSISRIGGLSTKYLKKGESHTYLSNITGEFEKSNEMTMSHAHDTTANTKMGSRKDLTIDENNRDSVLLKRLLRAKSQGGKAIEEALAEMANRDKETQLGARSNGRVLSLKNSMKDKRTLAAFKSVDEKSSIFKDSDVNRSTCNKTLNLEQKFESVMDHNSQEKSKESDQMGLLCKVLQRTKQMLGDYQEREKVWQSEKQDLLKQIINLQKSK